MFRNFKAGFSKQMKFSNRFTRIAEVITHHYWPKHRFKDAKPVLSDSGTAIMGSATASGENRKRSNCFCLRFATT
jgi:cell division protein FtsZ